MTKTDLVRTAGVAAVSYHYWEAGKRQISTASAQKLQQALRRHKIGFGAAGRDLAPHVAFKAVVALIAFELKTDAHLAVNAQPSRKAAMDPVWLAASRCRMIAYVVCNGCFGFTTSDIARAIGVDKSTVSLGIRQINDRRDDDAALDAVLNKMEAIFG